MGGRSTSLSTRKHTWIILLWRKFRVGDKRNKQIHNEINSTTEKITFFPLPSVVMKHLVSRMHPVCFYPMGRSLTCAAMTLRGLTYIQVTFYTSKYPVCPEPQRLSELLSMVSVCFVHVHLPSKASLAWKSLSPFCVCVCDFRKSYGPNWFHREGTWRRRSSAVLEKPVSCILKYHRNSCVPASVSQIQAWLDCEYKHIHTQYTGRKKKNHCALSTQNAYIIKVLICTHKAIAHQVWNFRMRSFGFFRIRHPFLSNCLLRMRKHRKSNLIWFFNDGQKFRRQCVNVIDTMWSRIYFLTCENLGLSVQWPLGLDHLTTFNSVKCFTKIALINIKIYIL